MGTSFKVTVPPTVEPVTLAEQKLWMRVNFTDEDALIQALITRARAWAEAITHRALAPQTIQQIETIERPIGGELSGPVQHGPSWYQYQEQLGANPFGAAQFYFDLAMPPYQSGTSYTLETKVTAFDPWTTFAQTTNPDGSTNTYIDDHAEPARLYVQSPVTANFWRLTFQAGYDLTSYVIPQDLKQAIQEAAAFWFENREGGDPPEGLKRKLLARRVDWL